MALRSELAFAEKYAEKITPTGGKMNALPIRADFLILDTP